MSAHASVRPLAWDSEHFGVRIASYQPASTSTLELASALAACREEGVECLYVLAPSDALDLVRALERRRARLVDVRMTLEAEVDAAVRAATVRASHPSDLPALRALAATSHQASRFYADGRFSRERCDALYATWIDKSCSGWADVVLVAEHEGTPCAYLTCHVRAGSRGEIGLVAVAPRARGRGLGGDLVASGLAYLGERGVERVGVVTQARNVYAQRLYQAHGFRTSRMELWYHLWIDETPNE